MDVVEESVVGVSFIRMWTVVVASARLDHHDVLSESFSIITAEPDLDSPGLLRSTASSIHTRATVFGTILLHTGTASVSELHWGLGLLSLGAFFPLLQERDGK